MTWSSKRQEWLIPIGGRCFLPGISSNLTSTTAVGLCFVGGSIARGKTGANLKALQQYATLGVGVKQSGDVTSCVTCHKRMRPRIQLARLPFTREGLSATVFTLLLATAHSFRRALFVVVRNVSSTSSSRR